FSGRKPGLTYRPGEAAGEGRTGLPQAAGVISDAVGDYQRQGMNFVGEIGNWLSGQKQPGMDQGWGDSVLGSRPLSIRPRQNSQGSGISPSRYRLGDVTGSSEEQQMASLPDLQSFLSQAMEILGGGQA